MSRHIEIAGEGNDGKYRKGGEDTDGGRQEEKPLVCTRGNDVLLKQEL